MTTAEVFTAGRVASPLDEHHIKRTRYAHQISLVALSLLKQEAYSTYREEVQGLPELFELPLLLSYSYLSNHDLMRTS